MCCSKNSRHVLPLEPRRLRSIAVIGADAASGAQISEGGSGAVTPTGDVITGLDGIRARVGNSARVGTPRGRWAPRRFRSCAATCCTRRPEQARTARPVLRVGRPVGGPGRHAGRRVRRHLRHTGVGPADRLVGALDRHAHPPRSGYYRFSVELAGKARLWIGGKRIVNVRYADFGTTAQPLVHLRAGHPVSVRLQYSSDRSLPGGDIHLGWQAPNGMRRHAARVAARSDAAVVFVNDSTGEGSDRTSLSLPGDQDRLIAAVARANPRTVVVLNTGGPVVMPWLHRVAGVLESWYPGQEGGAAVAALLFGDVDPSGRLPMTFPANERQGPASRPGGLGLHTERYSEGIYVGYRWFDATRERPLFPFGYGLSYTRFAYHQLRVRAGRASVQVERAGDQHRPAYRLRRGRAVSR